MTGVFARCRWISLGSLVLAFAFPAGAVEVGAVAPDFSLSGANGAVKLSDFKGKAVYLDFWASWCGPCKQSFPWMSDMQARYGNQGLQVIAVNLDKKQSDANAFLKQFSVLFDVVFDAQGQSPQAYDIKTMPTSVLIGKDGRVLMVHGGFKDDQRQSLEEYIKAALGVKS